jgi:hypothetical protein
LYGIPIENNLQLQVCTFYNLSVKIRHITYQGVHIGKYVPLGRGRMGQQILADVVGGKKRKGAELNE